MAASIEYELPPQLLPVELFEAPVLQPRTVDGFDDIVRGYPLPPEDQPDGQEHRSMGGAEYMRRAGRRLRRLGGQALRAVQTQVVGWQAIVERRDDYAPEAPDSNVGLTEIMQPAGPVDGATSRYAPQPPVTADYASAVPNLAAHPMPDEPPAESIPDTPVMPANPTEVLGSLDSDVEQVIALVTQAYSGYQAQLRAIDDTLAWAAANGIQPSAADTKPEIDDEQYAQVINESRQRHATGRDAASLAAIEREAITTMQSRSSLTALAWPLARAHHDLGRVTGYGVWPQAFHIPPEVQDVQAAATLP